MSQHTETLLGVVAKASPPVTVVVGAGLGIDWQEVVWQLTAVYLVVMTAKLIWDWMIKPNLRKRDP